MEDYDRTLELVNVAQDSAGRASEQFAKYEDTLANKINRLKNSWEKLRLSFADSAFFKKAVDLTNQFVSALGDLNKGSLVAVTTLGAVLGKNLTLGAIKSIKDSKSAITKAWAEATANTEQTSGLKRKMSFVSDVRTGVKTSESDINRAASIEASYRYNPVLLKAYKTQLELILKDEYQSENVLQSQLNTLNQLDTKTLNLLTTYSSYPVKVREATIQVIEQYNKTNDIKAAINSVLTSQEEVTEEYKQQLILASQLAAKIKESGAENLLGVASNKNVKSAAPSSASSEIGSIAISSLSQGLVAGFTTALGGGEFSTVLKTAIGAGAVSGISEALPSIIKTITQKTAVKGVLSKVAGFIATPQGAIAAAVAAAAGIGITMAVKAYKKHQIEMDVTLQTEAAEKELEKLQSAAKQISTDLTEKTSELTNLKKAVETVEKLQGKISKTDEEQEKFNSAVETLQDTYPEIITSYDEETERIQLNNKLLQERIKLLESQKEELDSSQLFADTRTIQQEATTKLLQTGQSFEEKTGAKLDATRIAENINQAFSNLQGYNNRDWTARQESLQNLLAENGVDIKDYQVLSSINEYIYDGIGNLSTIQELNQQSLVAIEKLHSEVTSFKESYQSQIKQGLYESAYEQAYERIKDDTDLSEGEKVIQAIKEATIEVNATEYGDRKLSDYKFSGNAEKTKEAYSQLISDIASDYGFSVSDLGLEKAAEDWSEVFENVTGGAWNSKDSYDKAIKKMTKTQKQLFESMGIIDQETYEDFITDAEGDQYSDKEMSKKFAEAVKSYVAQKIAENLDEADIQMSAAAEEAIKTASAADTSSKSYKEAFKTLQKEYGDNFEDTFEITGLDLKGKLNDITLATRILGKDTEFTVSQAQNLADIYSNLKDETGIDQAEELMTKTSKYLQEQGVGVEDLSKYFQIDWASVENEEGLKTFKQQTIKDFTELGLDLDEETFDVLSNIARQFKVLDTTLSDSVAVKKYAKQLSELQTTAFEKKDTIIDILNESAKNGSITLEKYLELEQLIADLGSSISINDLTSIDKNGKIKLNESALQAYYIQNISGAAKLQQELAKTEKSLTEAQHRGQTSQIEMYSSAVEQLKLQLKQAQDIQEGYLNDWVDSVNTASEESKTDLDELRKNVLDAQQDIIDKQKELNEVLYGTKDWINNADDMYNYATNLERVSKAADNAKTALEDLQDWDNPQQAMDEYLKNVKEENAIGSAEISVYEKAIQQGQAVFQSKLSEAIADLNKKYGSNISVDFQDLYTKVGDRYNIDYNKINSLQISDDIKSMLVEEVQSWNENLDKIDEIQDQKLKRQKEFNELYKNSLQGMVDLEEKMRDTLKEKYESEITDIENKYKAMEEADNDYVDELEKAIEKQRKLRDQENSWNDLAQKERKLSLLQRDTSGGNLAETKNLQAEIQSDREDLLDDTVDNIIDNLKELYELQQESREAEIEYRRELLDEGMLMQEVTAALSNINSAEDLVAWFYENTADLSSMSAEQIQLEEMEWRDLYDAKMSWLVTSQTDFNEALNVTAEDINGVILTTSETLTTSAQTTLDQIINETDEAIGDAQEALQDAYDNLKDQQEALNDAIKESTEAAKSWKTSAEEVRKILAEMNKTQGSTSSSYNPSDYYESREKNKNSAYGSGEISYDRPPFIGPQKNDKDVLNSKINYLFANQTKGHEPLSLGVSDTTDNRAAAVKAIQDYRAKNKKAPQLTGASLSSKDGKLYIVQSGNYDKGITYTKGKPNYTSIFSLEQYKAGGLVDFTGPAWVDGTRTRPEAFLSAEDTEKIGNAAKLLADLPILDSSNWQSTMNKITNTNVGDTTLEFHINIESIANDYDVDQAIERVKKEIVNSANYIGSNVIIRKT